MTVAILIASLFFVLTAACAMPGKSRWRVWDYLLHSSRFLVFLFLLIVWLLAIYAETAQAQDIYLGRPTWQDPYATPEELRECARRGGTDGFWCREVMSQRAVQDVRECVRQNYPFDSECYPRHQEQHEHRRHRQ